MCSIGQVVGLFGSEDMARALLGQVDIGELVIEDNGNPSCTQSRTLHSPSVQINRSAIYLQTE